MKEDEICGFTPPMCDYINDLLNKGDVANKKTQEHFNLAITYGDYPTFVKIDDHELFFIGCKLLPNIVNYLVNILPQFIYPYVVAYLQDLSAMRDDPITIHELFDYIFETVKNGNIYDCPETEG